jgi:maltooligosyltrehalose trehalohydrolase
MRKRSSHDDPVQSFASRQGVSFVEPSGVRWCVWAPNHRSVELVLFDGTQRLTRTMQPADEGYFVWVETIAPERLSQLRYAYRIPGFDLDLPDPASAWQPEGVHRPSAVFDPRTFAWSDHNWSGLKLVDLALYELHVGTFTPQGTLDAAAARLPELADLGVTAIELMPLAQFPGTRGWGYDGVHPQAVHDSYGGPAALQRFVDAAHRAGLGVVLDVVYNHLGPEGNYAGLLAPYFTGHYHTPWGDALNYDGPDSEPVRRFVIDSACRWIRDFHVDGLRLDAVQTIYDLGAQHILAELTEAVHAEAERCGRAALVTAETDQNDVRLVNPQERGGYGLDAVWSDDFHHALHALLTGERHGYYEDFGDIDTLVKAYNEVNAYDGCYSRRKRRRHGSPVGDLPREQFVVCIQNHDQIGNRAGGERLGTLIPAAAQRLAAALLLTSPCTPLIFMGEEYGETRPFPYFCSFLDDTLTESVRTGRAREFAEFLAAHKGELFDPHSEATFELARISWNWPGGTTAAGLRRLYRTLLNARRTFAPLADQRHARARRAGDESAGEESSLLVIERGETPKATVFANLSSRPTAVELPTEAQLLLSTEEAEFGGTGRALVNVVELLPYEFVLIGDSTCPTFPRPT